MWVTVRHANASQWCVALLASSAIVTTISVLAVTLRYGRPSFQPSSALGHATEGLEYAFGCSTISAYNDLDKTMLSHYGLNAANGIYSMAYRVIDMASTPIVSMQIAGEPRLYELASQGIDKAIQLGYRLMKRALLISALVGIVLFATAPLITYVVGKGFAEGASALRWLCIIPVFRSIHGITGSVLTCAGRQRYRTVSQFLAVLINLSLNFWLIPSYGWRGAAYASLATDGALAAMNWISLSSIRNKLARSLAMPGPMPVVEASTL